MELEVVNVASVEFTKKIQRERTRKHHLDEKLQRVKQQIQARQRELLHSRKKVQCHKGSGVQQLEKRLQALRTKYSVATTGNVKLRERVDHLRKEKESARQVHEQRTRELRHATVAFETLKKAVFQKQMETQAAPRRGRGCPAARSAAGCPSSRVSRAAASGSRGTRRWSRRWTRACRWTSRGRRRAGRPSSPARPTPRRRGAARARPRRPAPSCRGRPGATAPSARSSAPPSSAPSRPKHQMQKPSEVRQPPRSTLR